MKKIILLVFFGMGFYFLQAQTKNFIDQPYLETNAKADTLVTPDQIYLSITISESDTKGKTSVEELAKKMEKQLVGLGIDLKKQLTLNDLSSNFRKYFLRTKEVEKTKSYTLCVHTAKMAGKVILGLEKIDIAHVELEKTSYSKPYQIELLLKSKAIKKAHQQAVALAKPLGQYIGNAIYINDKASYSPQFFKKAEVMIRGMSKSANEQDEPLDIDFQKIKFQSEVNVKFILKPAN